MHGQTHIKFTAVTSMANSGTVKAVPKIKKHNILKPAGLSVRTRGVVKK